MRFKISVSFYCTRFDIYGRLWDTFVLSIRRENFYPPSQKAERLG